MYPVHQHINPKLNETQQQRTETQHQRTDRGGWIVYRAHTKGGCRSVHLRNEAQHQRTDRNADAEGAGGLSGTRARLPDEVPGNSGNLKGLETQTPTTRLNYSTIQPKTQRRRRPGEGVLQSLRFEELEYALPRRRRRSEGVLQFPSSREL